MGTVREAIRHIVLTGLMGSGKTTVGRELAGQIGWEWRDSDTDIQAATGRTVRELRDEEGVDAMHAREAAQVIDALTGTERTVISAAASVVEAPDARAVMARPDVAVVWLHASPKVLASRFAAGEHRPSYGDDPEAFLAEQAARREPMAAELGAIVIDASSLTIEDVVARTIEALG
jgi:shikimate kinase